jgi:hypothetical protein
MLQRSALALFVALLLGEAGCIHPKTYISQGQVLTTGNAAYDNFFKSVRDLHAEAERAQADERVSHGALISALGLEAKTTAKITVSEAGLRAKKIRDAGILIHLEIVPDQKVVTKKEKRDAILNPEGKDFIKAVEEATRSSLALSARIGDIATRAAQLEKVRIDLRAKAPVAFRTEVDSRRDEILEEIDGAAAVLADAVGLSERYAGLAAKFVVDLAHALETGGDVTIDDAAAKSAATQLKSTSSPATAAAAVTPPSSFASTEPQAQPVTKKPPPVGAAPRRPRRPPAAKPPPRASVNKPKGSDDFEP